MNVRQATKCAKVAFEDSWTAWMNQWWNLNDYKMYVYHMEIWQSRIDPDHQERHEQQLKGLNGGRAARGREDGGGDRSRKVSAAIEKAIEDAEGSIGMQQQQQRRGRNHCLPFLRNLHKKFERDLKRHPIRLRMELVSLFILVHCLMYTCLIGLVAWQRGYNYGEAAFIFALRLIFAIRLILIVAVPICHLASIQELKFRVGGHHFPEPGISIGGDWNTASRRPNRKTMIGYVDNLGLTLKVYVTYLFL